MAHAAEEEPHAEPLGGGNDIGIAQAASGFHKGVDAIAGGQLQAIRKGEECVAAQCGAFGPLASFAACDLHAVHPGHLACADAHGDAVFHEYDGVGFDGLGQFLREHQIFLDRLRAPTGGFDFPLLEFSELIIRALHQKASPDRAKV